MSKANTSVQIIFGAYNIHKFAEGPEQLYDTLQKHDVTRLDSARAYPNSESFIATSGASNKFIIDTKAPGGEGSLSPDNIRYVIAKSLSDLGLSKVDTYYFHSPDPKTPLEESLRTVDELYRAEKLERFGLSNYNAPEVEKIHVLCQKNGWVLPTVYEGNYNPVARHFEEQLFPTLRRLSISFRAYSPLAGGFLLRSAEELRAGNQSGRFDPNTFIGQMYLGLYGKPELLDALGDWEKISVESGISKAALAYRYVAYNSALKGQHGDGMILGASRLSQLQESLTALEAGPLPASVVEKIDAYWRKIKDFAPVHNL